MIKKYARCARETTMSLYNHYLLIKQEHKNVHLGYNMLPGTFQKVLNYVYLQVSYQNRQKNDVSSRHWYYSGIKNELNKLKKNSYSTGNSSNTFENNFVGDTIYQ